MTNNLQSYIDSAAVSIFVVILVELTNRVFVNLTNIPANIETARARRRARGLIFQHFIELKFGHFLMLWFQKDSLDRVGFRTFRGGPRVLNEMVNFGGPK